MLAISATASSTSSSTLSNVDINRWPANIHAIRGETSKRPVPAHAPAMPTQAITPLKVSIDPPISTWDVSGSAAMPSMVENTVSMEAWVAATTRSRGNSCILSLLVRTARLYDAREFFLNLSGRERLLHITRRAQFQSLHHPGLASFRGHHQKRNVAKIRRS